MASKYDIEPGTFETISNQNIGTFILDEWTHIKLDGIFPFLMSNIVLKLGAAVIPGSAYELAMDADATTQESGLTGDTLNGMLRITNVTYTGVVLNISGSNFGSYVSNEAVREHVTEEIAGKMAPGSDLFIEAGEPAIFEGSTGLSVVSDNNGEIPLFDIGTVYSVAGTLTRLEGVTASASGKASNQNKNPLLQINSPFWFVPPDELDLLRMANKGEPIGGGMHPIHDRADALYAQNLRIGKKKISGSQYEFHIIHLDGTVVTGNTTLENLLDVGGANENPYIDIYAPDVLGTRTLIDMGGRVTEDMTSGGFVDVMGFVHDDYMMRIKGTITDMNVVGSKISNPINPTGALVNTNSLGLVVSPSSTGGTGRGIKHLDFDSANSISPNAAKTNDDRTAHAALVTGISYIVVMVAT